MTEPHTLPFDAFWGWLVAHPNCILRAGTPESVIYDDEDLHWHFAVEDSETLLVQVLRGKRLVAEILVHPEQVAYVQTSTADPEGEFVFELISESERERLSLYYFVLTHGYEEEGSYTAGRVH